MYTYTIYVLSHCSRLVLKRSNLLSTLAWFFAAPVLAPFPPICSIIFQEAINLPTHVIMYCLKCPATHSGNRILHKIGFFVNTVDAIG